MRDDVLIKINRVFELDYLSVRMVCAFDEANVWYRNLGDYMIKLHEDMSHSWGILWKPVCNEKLSTEFVKLYKEAIQAGVREPNVEDVVTALCTFELSKELLPNPRTRIALQARVGTNSGFVHYMDLAEVLQIIKDVMFLTGFR